MNKLTASSTAERIRTFARTFHVTYTQGPNDRLAHHMSRLAGDTVEFDEIEQLLIGLQRANLATHERAARAPLEHELPLAVALTGPVVLAGTAHASVYAASKTMGGGDGGGGCGGGGGGGGCGGCS